MIETDLQWARTEPAETTQLLDEHHLVVVGDDRDSTWRFTAQIGERLAAIADTRVVTIDGRRVESVGTFCDELATGLGVTCRDRGLDTVIELLRSAPGAPRHQFFLWRDAERLVSTDPELFGCLANAMLAVAAEKEHVSPGALVLQRSVFVGGARLEAYASEQESQLRTWLLEDGATRFWEVISSVPHPPVLTYSLSK